MLVAGVGLLVVVQEALRLAQGGGTIWLQPVAGEPWLLTSARGFDVLAHPRLLIMVVLDWLAIGLTLYAMKKTPLGRAWRASADDPLAASLCGIDPRKLLIQHTTTVTSASVPFRAFAAAFGTPNRSTAA